MSMDGRTCVITGSARGIGRGIAEYLGEEGANVVINYRSSEGPAYEAVDAIEAAGGSAVAAQANVSEREEVEHMREVCHDAFGPADVLVNNAGITADEQFTQMTREEWDRVMEVNLKGPFLMVKATADLLTAARGCVINLVDLSAFQPWVDYPHHAVSKAGLLHLTRVMARAMAPRVRVNAIAPGSVLPPDDSHEKDRERSRSRAALGSLGSPEDVVRTVLFLDRSPFITGEVIVVDGGRLLG